MTTSVRPRRASFKVLRPIQTRWMDNDHYGYINNVAYYSYFDTAVNRFLIEASGTYIRDLPAIGIVAKTGCRFLKETDFPTGSTRVFMLNGSAPAAWSIGLRCSVGRRTT